MTDKVIVIIVPDKDTKVPRNDLITNVFSNEMFVVIQSEGKKKDCDYNNGRVFYDALLLARNVSPQSPCIIIKNTSVSDLTPDTMAANIKQVLSIPHFQLCYLCKWLDACQYYRNSTSDPIKPSDPTAYMFTRYPGGLQSILFTPEGRDMILGLIPMLNGKMFKICEDFENNLRTDIYEGNVRAITSVPNIVNFDIVLNASRYDDYIKTNECSPFDITPSNNYSDTSNLIGFLIAVALILLLAWAALKAGPKK